MKWSHVIIIIIVLLLLSLASTTKIIRQLTFDQQQQIIIITPSIQIPISISSSAQKTDGDDGNDIHQKITKKIESPHHEHEQTVATYAPGRDKERGHQGLDRNSKSNVAHAWGAEEEDTSLKCHGTEKIPDCTTQASYDYAAKHVLFVIVTGADATFRVEVSQCTWLARLPAENVYVVTDSLPHPKPRTPHHWIKAKLPKGMTQTKTGDFVSEHMPKGYLHAVRSAGQGYGASWIAAQTRFTYGLHVAAKKVHENPDIRWVMLMDDDTILQLDHFVNRVKYVNESQQPWYFSRKGWGGAGHLYSRKAMEIIFNKLHECEDKWFVRQFRASDAMLLKCASHLKLRVQMEGTMSHCPASSSPERIESTKQITMHGKKDFYPPVLLATWRISLYYLAMYCRSSKAMKDVVEWSACTYGSSCKRSSCDQVVDARRERRWKEFSKNETMTDLWKDVIGPMGQVNYIHDIKIPTRIP